MNFWGATVITRFSSLYSAQRRAIDVPVALGRGDRCASSVTRTLVKRYAGYKPPLTPPGVNDNYHLPESSNLKLILNLDVQSQKITQLQGEFDQQKMPCFRVKRQYSKT